MPLKEQLNVPHSSLRNERCAMPCKATAGNTRFGQEAERVKGKPRPGPSLQVCGEGLAGQVCTLELTDLNNFSMPGA